MPTSIWTQAEGHARDAIRAALNEGGRAPDEFNGFWRKFGPACVGNAIDNLSRPDGLHRLEGFVREALARHVPAVA